VPTQRLTDYRPRTLGEYADIVDDLQAAAGGPLWYRGASGLAVNLLPSLYRPRQNPDAFRSTLSELEAQLVTRFRDRSLPYHSRPLNDNLDILFFMQHYGIPTRLLDWTENPFFGLFFALRTAKHQWTEGGALNFIRDAAVWVLDPTDWNQAALAHMTYLGGPLDPAHPNLRAYSSIGEIDSLASNPVAIYGAHNSQRIVAQQGTFAIFGSSTIPMETLYRRGIFPSKALSRIVLSRNVIPKLRTSIFSHGITEGTLFPDLEGLGRDICRYFGYSI
jgi:hypothetical protein